MSGGSTKRRHIEVPGSSQSSTQGKLDRFRGRWRIVCAALLWSTSGFFVKSHWFDSWPIETRGIQLAFWRCLFAGLFLLPLVRRPRWSWRLVPAGLFFLAMNVTYLTAMTSTTAANAIWLQYTAPMWVLFIGVGFFKETATRADHWMIGLCMLGVLVIVSCEVCAALVLGYSFEGIVWGVIGGISFAGVILSMRTLRDLDSLWMVTWCMLTTAVALGPYVVWTNQWPSTPQWMPLVLFGVAQLGVGYVLFAMGVRSISGHEASGILLLEPILVPIWVFVAWRNSPGYTPPAIWTIVGGGFILVGLLIRYVPRGMGRDLFWHRAK